MKSKDVTIGEKVFKIKELLYIDIIELGSVTDKKEHAIKLIELSGVNRDTLNELTVSEGQKLMSEINELNGFQDFQKTSSESKDS